MPLRVPSESERLLAHLARAQAESERFTDSLCALFKIGGLQLLDAYLPLLTLGFVTQARTRESDRDCRTRLDVSPKGLRYLEQVQASRAVPARPGRAEATR